MANPILDSINKANAGRVPATVPSTPELEEEGVPGSAAMLAIQDAIGVQSDRILQFIQQMQQDAVDISSTTGVITSAIDSAVDANQTINLVKDTAAMEAQNNTFKAYEAAGGIEAQIAYMKQLNIDNARLRDLQEEKLATMSEEYTGIQLIDTIINGFSSIQTDAEIEAAANLRQTTLSNVQAVTAGTESVAQAQEVTKRTYNSATIQANYERLAAESTLKSAEAHIANIGTNANAMARVLDADSKQIAALSTIYRMENEQEDRALKREQHAFERERMVEMRKQWADGKESREVALKAAKLNLSTAQATNPTAIPAAIARNEEAVRQRDQNLALEANIVKSVQVAEQLIGGTLSSPEVIINSLLGTGVTAATRAKYERLQELGSSTDPVIGLTPFDTAQNLALVDPANKARRTKAIKVVDRVMQLQAEAFAENPTTAPKTEEALKQDFNNRSADFMKDSADAIRTGDTSNPYHGAPFSTLEQYAAVKNSALYQKVLKGTGITELNPILLVDRAAAGVKAKSVTLEQAAAGIAVIFETAKVRNNTEDGGFRRAGLPNQETYNVSMLRDPTAFELLKSGAASIPQSPFLLTSALTGNKEGFARMVSKLGDRHEKVDLSDYTDVRLHLAKKLRGQAPTPTPQAE